MSSPFDRLQEFLVQLESAELLTAPNDDNEHRVAESRSQDAIRAALVARDGEAAANWAMKFRRLSEREVIRSVALCERCHVEDGKLVCTGSHAATANTRLEKYNVIHQGQRRSLAAIHFVKMFEQGKP